MRKNLGSVFSGKNVQLANTVTLEELEKEDIVLTISDGLNGLTIQEFVAVTPDDKETLEKLKRDGYHQTANPLQ